MVLTRSLLAGLFVLALPGTSISASLDEQFGLDCTVNWKRAVVGGRWVAPKPTKLHVEIDRRQGTVKAGKTTGSFSEDGGTMTITFKGRYYDTVLELASGTGELAYLIQAKDSSYPHPEQTGTCKTSGQPGWRGGP